MKVLLLQSKPFLPVRDGGNEASRALTQQLLDAGYHVDCLTFSSEKHPFQQSEFMCDPWNKLRIEHVHISLKIELFSALFALVKGNSYNLSRFSHAQWLKKLNEFATDYQYHVILFDSLYSANNLEEIKQLFPSSMFIIRPHNVEFKLWEEHAYTADFRLKKSYLSLLSRQLKKREIQLVNQFDLVLPISSLDDVFFRNFCETKTEVFPYFPDVSEEKFNPQQRAFFFLGAMNWRPNKEAHDQLIDHIFPEILRELPDATLTFAGSAQTEFKKSTLNNVSYTGFVADKEDFMLNNGILLAPILTGSGVRIKLLEALSLGIPVVTTAKGAEGIPFANGDGLFIAENDIEFIEFSIRLYKNQKLRSEISDKAKKNMHEWRKKYNLKSIFDRYVTK